MFKLNQTVDHNVKFLEAFIDLKVEGWKSFEKALNAYTSGYYSNQLENMTVGVEQSASTMKKIMKGMKDYV